MYPVIIPISHPPPGALTAEQAVRAAHPEHPHWPLPAGVDAYYGVPLVATRAQRVWGFRSGPAPCLTSISLSPPLMCFEWDFVNAFTGHPVASLVQQELRSGH